MWEGRGREEGDKQTLQWTWSPTWGSVLCPWDHDLSKPKSGVRCFTSCATQTRPRLRDFSSSLNKYFLKMWKINKDLKGKSYKRVSLEKCCSAFIPSISFHTTTRPRSQLLTVSGDLSCVSLVERDRYHLGSCSLSVHGNQLHIFFWIIA